MTEITEVNSNIWNTPEVKKEVEAFRNNIRQYWKKNVKKHFSKRVNNYGGLHPKLNHRFLISPFGSDRQPILKNALVIRWMPEANHINVYVSPIMVESIGNAGHKQGLYKINKNKTFGPNKNRYKETKVFKAQRGQTAYDLIDLLSKGTRTSDRRYNVRYDARVPPGDDAGVRKGTNNKAWLAWFTEFLNHVDGEIERLADNVADIIEKQLVMPEEF